MACREKLAVTAIQRLGCECVPRRVDKGENETKRALFTLKRSVTGQLDSIEHETEVRDPDAMIAIVKGLGFVAFSDMSKIRQTGTLNGTEVCVDSVEGLGR